MPDLINELADLLINNEAVLFIDASLPRGPNQLPPTRQIVRALAARMQDRRVDRSLPDVAQNFQSFHENSRQPLISAVCEEVERLEGQPAPILQRIAEVVLPHTKIITTQFDRTLETTLRAFGKEYFLIRQGADVSFYDESKIALIKLQGDINDPDSLKITEEDIQVFIENSLPRSISDLIGAFFATRTLIFLGHDPSSSLFKDFHFKQIYRQRMFSRPAYAILPQSAIDPIEVEKWWARNLQIHCLDQDVFLEALTQAIKAKVIRRPSRPVPEQLELPSHPYKRLDSFTRADAAIFAGRTEESRRLANRILAHPLTVLYGASGSGKTSLLQAGAGPLLSRQQVLLATGALAAGQPLLELMRQSLVKAGRLAELSPPDESSLSLLVQTWQQELDRPIVMVVDQFEQFFLAYSSGERLTVIEDLGNLLNDASLNLRLVLVVREDFLGQVESLTEQIPGLLDVRFRLERLNRAAASAAIEEPARHFNITWEPALLQKLLDELYEGDNGGVAPPQLQIVCDHLYWQFARSFMNTTNGRNVQITLAQFDSTGGTTKILSNYLDQILFDLPRDKKKKVRELLGALVTSSGVKQRLPLADLARAAELEPDEAANILDWLTQERLLQRFEVPAETRQAGRSRWEYELVHDYLADQITSWLGPEFWQRQLVREIVRQALPDWQNRGWLLSSDNLRLVNEHRSHIRFSAAELEMIYAAAISNDNGPAAWQSCLPQATRRHILLRLLLKHPDGATRCQAANHLAAFPRALAAFPRAEVPTVLARTAVSDPDVAVREAAAQGVATLVAPDGRAPGRIAVNQVVKSIDSANGQYALQALVIICDQQPTSHDFLPANLRDEIRGRVWLARWQRHRPQILSKIFRGALGGYIMGMALVGLFFDEGVTSLSRKVLETILLGAYTLGPVGTLSVGGAQFVRVLLHALQDYVNARRTWFVVTLVGTLLLGLSFVLLILLGMGDLRLVGTGLLIGFVLLIVALAPLKMAKHLHLVLTILAGMIIFWMVGVGLLSLSPKSWWLLPMGAVAGISVFWALQSEILSKS